MDQLLSNYQKLNKSYKKRLVFRIGMEAGFFSEYNNMILAMLYCLMNKIQFVLYSDNANFAFERGWEDYFLPFCEEEKKDFHRKYNHRYPGAPFNKLDRLKILFYKKLYNIDYLTHEIWYQIRDKDYFESKKYHIPELGINGDILEACRTLVKITWRYNDTTQSEIRSLKQKVKLPKEYIGLHIRQGDKNTEQELLSSDTYIQKAEGLSQLKNTFVLTDDYNIIKQLQELRPLWNIQTLCDETEHGYIHSEFQKLDKIEIKKSIIKLFASIDILSHSSLFIGTFSSNPGMFLGMRMESDKCYGLDSDKWQIW